MVIVQGKRDVRPSRSFGEIAVMAGALCCASWASSAQEVAPPRLPGIYVLRGDSVGSGVSGDGAFVVGHLAGPGGGGVAQRWSTGGLMPGETGENLGAGLFSMASAANADGSVVVGRTYTPTATVAFRWTGTTGVVELGSLRKLPGDTQARGVSGDGSIVVGESLNNEGVTEAFRWTPEGGMVGLGVLPGHYGSSANAITPDGRVIAGDADSPVMASRPRGHGARILSFRALKGDRRVSSGGGSDDSMSGRFGYNTR